MFDQALAGCRLHLAPRRLRYQAGAEVQRSLATIVSFSSEQRRFCFPKQSLPGNTDCVIQEVNRNSLRL